MSHCLAQASHGRGHTHSTRTKVPGRTRATVVGARQLNVARDVVVGGIVQATNTIRTTVRQRVGGRHQLYLAEHTTGGDDRLAVVTEDGRTSRTDQRRGVRALGIHVRGERGGRIRTRVHVERGDARGHVDVVASIRGDLLQVSQQRRHFSIPLLEKKDFQKPVSKQSDRRLWTPPVKPLHPLSFQIRLNDLSVTKMVV